MREIKFRAWDKETKRMLCPKELVSDNRHLNVDLGKIIVPCYDDTDFIEEDLILMQFTGLFDKNGKMVFEGDTVLVPDEAFIPITDEGQGPIDPCDHIVSIEFRDGCFGFEIPSDDYGETGWFTFPMWDEYWDTKWGTKEIKVIGNIYEDLTNQQ